MSYEPHPALAVLRARFPTWGILHDFISGRWIAVRGREARFSASSPEMLQHCLVEYTIAEWKGRDPPEHRPRQGT